MYYIKHGYSMPTQTWKKASGKVISSNPSPSLMVKYLANYFYHEKLQSMCIETGDDVLTLSGNHKRKKIPLKLLDVIRCK